jgi:hypothetical protein
MNKQSILKKIASISFLLFTGISYGQDSNVINTAATSTTSNSAKIIFMRSTGYAGSATAFTTFIDDNLVCKLNNKKFSTHMVEPGEHTFSVQFAGKTSKEKAERIIIKTEAGKTYYVQLIFQSGAFVNNLYCQEVTESSANIILPKLKEDTSCL